MFASLALAAFLAATPAPGAPCAFPADRLPDEELRGLYESGEDFDAFLEAARRRRALWLSNHEEASVPAELLARARAVSGSWRLLVVAIDACSDSVSTIPYVAKLVALVEGLDMRIVDSAAGRAVMEAHPTPDGRAATPTLVLLDGSWEEAGCFIERPQALVGWLDENAAGMSNQDFYASKMDWYARDAGRATVQQIVEMMEAASRGRSICR